MRRVCLYFSSSLPSFSSLYLLFVLHLVCFVLVVFVVFIVVSFSLSDYTQKERAQFSCVLSSCVIDLVGVRFPVLVKFVIVSVNLFGYTFIGGRIFVIISPLLEKAFEDTLNKIPRVKFVLYALLYII